MYSHTLNNLCILYFFSGQQCHVLHSIINSGVIDIFGNANVQTTSNKVANHNYIWRLSWFSYVHVFCDSILFNITITSPVNRTKGKINMKWPDQSLFVVEFFYRIGKRCSQNEQHFPILEGHLMVRYHLPEKPTTL